MMDTSTLPLRSTLLARAAALVLVPIMAVASAACASDPTAPTPDPVIQSLEVYSGPLDPGGTSTYLFSLSQRATVQVMLAGVVTGAPMRSIAPTLRVELKAWNGSECEVRYSLDTAPRMTAALHAYLDPGTYCATVTDALGTLTETVGATVRITAPALIRTGGEPGTAEFASTVAPAGTTSRTFVASTQGMAALTLTSLSAGAVEVGLGVGLMSTDGGGCRLTQIVHAVPGTAPQLTARIDPGDYCAMVFDTGGITRPESFSLTIVHP